MFSRLVVSYFFFNSVPGYISPENQQCQLQQPSNAWSICIDRCYIYQIIRVHERFYCSSLYIIHKMTFLWFCIFRITQQMALWLNNNECNDISPCILWSTLLLRSLQKMQTPCWFHFRFHFSSGIVCCLWNETTKSVFIRYFFLLYSKELTMLAVSYFHIFKLLLSFFTSIYISLILIICIIFLFLLYFFFFYTLGKLRFLSILIK